MDQYIASSSSYQNRTAGQQSDAFKSVQAWKSKKAPQASPFSQSINKQPAVKQAQANILNELDKASQGKIGVFNPQFGNATAYAPSDTPITDNQIINTAGTTKQGFEFEDVVDVINPLHHLPVVGMVYRGLTGDKLHPMSQIIGGALYGGPVGAVTGTINAIAQVQTGKDMSDHALGMMGFKSFTPDPVSIVNKDDPVEQLNDVAGKVNNNHPLENLPGNAIAFANLSNNQEYETTSIAEGRTAGSQHVEKRSSSYEQNFAKQYNGAFTIQDFINTKPSEPAQQIDLNKLAAYAPVTAMSVSQMPPRQEF